VNHECLRVRSSAEAESERECTFERCAKQHTPKQTRGERDPLLNAHGTRKAERTHAQTPDRWLCRKQPAVHPLMRAQKRRPTAKANASSAHTNRHTGKEATHRTVSGPLHRRGHQNERRHRSALSVVRHRLFAGSSLRRDPAANAHRTPDAGASQIDRSPNTNADHHTHPPSLEEHRHPNTHTAAHPLSHAYARETESDYGGQSGHRCRPTQQMMHLPGSTSGTSPCSKKCASSWTTSPFCGKRLHLNLENCLCSAKKKKRQTAQEYRAHPKWNEHST
jgi:hypothetical protein